MFGWRHQKSREQDLPTSLPARLRQHNTRKGDDARNVWMDLRRPLAGRALGTANHVAQSGGDRCSCPVACNGDRSEYAAAAGAGRESAFGVERRRSGYPYLGLSVAAGDCYGSCPLAAVHASRIRSVNGLAVRVTFSKRQAGPDDMNCAPRGQALLLIDSARRRARRV